MAYFKAKRSSAEVSAMVLQRSWEHLGPFGDSLGHLGTSWEFNLNLGASLYFSSTLLPYHMIASASGLRHGRVLFGFHSSIALYL